MRWIAPTEKDAETTALEKHLWDAADHLRANSGLTSQQYAMPILGLIFLRFAEARFTDLRAKLEAKGASSRQGSQVDNPSAYHAQGVVFLDPKARFDHLLTLPQGEDARAAVNSAMHLVSSTTRNLQRCCPRFATYSIGEFSCGIGRHPMPQRRLRTRRQWRRDVGEKFPGILCIAIAG